MVHNKYQIKAPIYAPINEGVAIMEPAVKYTYLTTTIFVREKTDLPFMNFCHTIWWKVGGFAEQLYTVIEQLEREILRNVGNKIR